MIKNRDVFSIHYYSYNALINKLYENYISVYKIEKLDEYNFIIETSSRYRKKIKRIFCNCKIVRKTGIINYIERIFLKSTFYCLVISSLFLYCISQKIWKIDIVGDYKPLEEEIINELNMNNIKINEYYPSYKALTNIEHNIFNILIEKIEFFEIKRKGSLISVRYQKRRKSIALPNKTGKLYANKDGVVKMFDIKSGVKKVKENEYVRKGDLLVDDILETSNGNNVNIGTLGSVFAHTFYFINVSVKNDGDEANVFSLLLYLAKLEISKELSYGEKIIREQILSYNLDEEVSTMKIYYVLLEDITI